MALLTGDRIFPTACQSVKVVASHTPWTVSSQITRAHLSAVHVGVNGQLLISSACQTSELMPQFTPSIYQLPIFLWIAPLYSSPLSQAKFYPVLSI